MSTASSWPSGDQHYAFGRAVEEIGVNGEKAANVDLPLGRHEGRARATPQPPGSTLLRSFHEVPVPASVLRAGKTLLSSTRLKVAG